MHRWRVFLDPVWRWWFQFMVRLLMWGLCFIVGMHMQQLWVWTVRASLWKSLSHCVQTLLKKNWDVWVLIRGTPPWPDFKGIEWGRKGLWCKDTQSPQSISQDFSSGWQYISPGFSSWEIQLFRSCVCMSCFSNLVHWPCNLEFYRRNCHELHHVSWAEFELKYCQIELTLVCMNGAKVKLWPFSYRRDARLIMRHSLAERQLRRPSLDGSWRNRTIPGFNWVQGHMSFSYSRSKWRAKLPCKHAMTCTFDFVLDHLRLQGLGSDCDLLTLYLCCKAV